MRKWRIEDSAELYNITGWGLKYFSINEKGHVQVTPREDYAPVDLKELMDRYCFVFPIFWITVLRRFHDALSRQPLNMNIRRRTLSFIRLR